jgi:exosome complex RNA-binding protein Rrp42 (RNase PH superfamily)
MPTAEKPRNDQGEGMQDGIKELAHQQAAGEVYEESRQVSSRTVEEALRKLGAIDLKQMRISYKWDEAVRLKICSNRAEMILLALYAHTYP